MSERRLQGGALQALRWAMQEKREIVLEDFFGCTVMNWRSSRDEDGWPDHVVALMERQHCRLGDEDEDEDGDEDYDNNKYEDNKGNLDMHGGQRW
ncbi:hypothetical protein GT037_003524 [Alternaria burnsii]|uniref:Uncharacterized protein n=1 Tax=Alternaria burnsii TaxID=1187904 RepID=A0A8H7EGU5_9PLEO|nr:uncharacterized protein GT037_003524 [Alternaria burnsii]KAF7678143.1 hypothetical protein GT037_003524 [Alternaria burnsii]